MKNTTLIFAAITALFLCGVGCKTNEPKPKDADVRVKLTHIETKNRYMLASELDKKNEVGVAVVNIVMPKGNASALAAELTFGHFRPRNNGGKVYVQADTVTLRYQSIQNLVKALSEKVKDPPIGIFMLVDEVALGTDNSLDIDEDIMSFTREFDSLLADENIQQVYLIPDNFSISYK